MIRLSHHPRFATLASLSIMALMTTIFLPACAFLRLAQSEKLKVPEISYLRTVVKSYDNEKAVVDFVLNAKNPNKIGLKNVAVDYELFHEGRRFLKGDGIELSLAPSGNTEIRIPATIAYNSVFSTAYALTQRIIAGDSTVPVRLDAVVSGKPTLYNEVEEGSLFSFTKSLSRTEQIPIPRKQLDDATESAKKRALDEIRKRF